jgi:two-component system, sensor histidine kinase RegB
MAELEPTVTLPWLVRLRWLFLAGQVVVFPIAHWGFDVQLEWSVLALALGCAAASNLAIARLHQQRKTWSSASLMGGVLVLDTALLTMLLAASGGSMNPFTVFYLVYVTLSAVVLSARWTISIAALSLAGFGLLFVASHTSGMHLHGSATSFSRHLQSMWAAYALAAVLVTFFIGKITRAIAIQREQISTLREANARNARLAALTTLAAGAAHELGSPLGTIAVAAHEAALRAASVPGAAAIARDLQLILLEVDRCQGILHQMSGQAPGPADAEPLTVDRLAAQVRELLGPARARAGSRSGCRAITRGSRRRPSRWHSRSPRWSRMRSRPVRTTRRWWSPWRARRPTSRSRSSIAAPGSPTTCCRGSANHSSPPSSRAAAWGSACSSRARSSRAAAAPC